jgi:hypothetical protein
MDVKDAEQSAKQGDLAVAITVSAQVDNKQIVLQTYIARDEPVGAYHKLVDKLTRVIERQEWKLHVVGIKATIETDKRTLKAMEADFQRIELDAAERWKAARKQGEVKLNLQETVAKNTSKTSIEARRENIAKFEAGLKELEQKLAKEE